MIEFLLTWITICAIVGALWGILCRKCMYRSHLFIFFDSGRFGLTLFGSLVLFLILRSLAERDTISLMVNIKVYVMICAYTIGAIVGYANEPLSRHETVDQFIKRRDDQ